jgi:hypothetical protein
MTNGSAASNGWRTAFPIAEYSLLKGGDDLLVGVNLVVVQDGRVQVLHLSATQPALLLASLLHKNGEIVEEGKNLVKK